MSGKQPRDRSKMNKYFRDWKERHPERAKELSEQTFRTFYGTIKGRATHMLNNARQRAKRLKVEYALTSDFLVKKLEAGTCEVTGIPFEFKAGAGKGHRTNPFSPSLDRIRQNGGYTPDNIRVVVWVYNRARGAFPDDAFRHFVLQFAERLTQEKPCQDESTLSHPTLSA